jgi:hypothetical protein
LPNDDARQRVHKLRSLLAVAASQPTTEQTAYDLVAIRATLRRAEADLNRAIERRPRKREAAT